MPCALIRAHNGHRDIRRPPDRRTADRARARVARPRGDRGGEPGLGVRAGGGRRPPAGGGPRSGRRAGSTSPGWSPRTCRTRCSRRPAAGRCAGRASRRRTRSTSSPSSAGPTRTGCARSPAGSSHRSGGLHERAPRHALGAGRPLGLRQALRAAGRRRQRRRRRGPAGRRAGAAWCHGPRRRVGHGPRRRRTGAPRAPGHRRREGPGLVAAVTVRRSPTSTWCSPTCSG